ncbi:MAG: adenylate/guanylate cyclase domain-containing protein [Acidobacteriota bacterium]|nr:FHA domain-containing protein [Blastocatellia bacterium]MDW8239571.1 adenylate/guanylate cyclase domain-containing protein [Acidobacteriota bacterium]
MAKLKVTLPATGQAFDLPVSDTEVRIGRHPDNHIVVQDNRASRFHAVIKREAKSYMVKDLGSQNGTTVNGQEIARDQWVPFSAGDRVVLAKGAAIIELVEDGDVSPALSFSDMPVSGATIVRSSDQIIGEVAVSDATKLLAGGPQQILSELTRLKKHIDKQAERIKLLSRLSQALGSITNLDQIYERSVDLLFHFTPADRCLILLRAPESDELQLVYSRYRPDRIGIQAIPVSRTITTRTFQEQQSVLWSQVAADSKAPGTLVKHGIHSVMCAPLIGRHQLLGVIYADRQSPTDVFEVDDLELLNTVSGPTAIAIDNALAFEQLRREEIARAAYNRFLPPHLVNKLLANPEAIHLGGVNQVVTILFSDVRGFTSLAEQADPQKVVSALNDYFSEMTEIIFQNNGTLDKFIGDGLMALFGAPESSPDDPTNAVRTAIQMQRRMVSLSHELTRYGFPPINIGIGINTGEVTVGYIGSERRMDYTAIGDAVNLTARLESKAAPGQILISQATAALIQGTFPLRSLGPLQVKGKMNLVETYEVLWQEI